MIDQKTIIYCLEIKMNKFKLSILFILPWLFLGCGTFKALIIEEEFKPFYEKFEEYYGMYPQVSIKMAKDENFTHDNKTVIIGTCSHNRNLIKINEHYWPRFTDKQKLILIFHELGHCFLKRKHNNYILPDTCPYSIMNKKMISDKCIRNNFEHYIKELY